MIRFPRRFGAMMLAALAGAVCAPARAAEPPVVTVTRPGPVPAFDALAVRVMDEAPDSALRLAAFANDALGRRGIRPDIAAPLTAVLRFDRPRIVHGPDRPAIALEGRGGSSGKSEFGVTVQIPIQRRDGEPDTLRMTMRLRLERAGGAPYWEGEATADVADTPDAETRAARDLIDALIARLVHAAKSH